MGEGTCSGESTECVLRMLLNLLWSQRWTSIPGVGGDGGDRLQQSESRKIAKPELSDYSYGALGQIIVSGL